MVVSNKFLDAHKSSPVLLVGIGSNKFQETESTEPQMIRKRAQNLSYIWINSDDAGIDNKVPPTDIIITGNLHKSGLKRISLNLVDVCMTTPNVNVRNNEIKFQSSNTGAVVYSFTVPEAQHDDAKILWDAIVIGLNAVPGHGLVFSIVYNASLDNRVATLSSAGGSYIFVESTATTHGGPLWNLPNPNLDALSVSKVIGYIHLAYTRFIEFRSNTLTQFSKNHNMCASSGSNTCIYRLFPDVAELGKPGFVREKINNLVSFNFNPSYTIQSVDISVHDEFGEILYVPQGAVNTSGGFYYQLSFIAET